MVARVPLLIAVAGTMLLVSSCSDTATSEPARSTDATTVPSASKSTERGPLARIVKRDPEAVFGSRDGFAHALKVARQLRKQDPTRWGRHFVIGSRMSVWIRNDMTQQRALQAFGDRSVPRRQLRIKRERYTDEQLSQQVDKASHVLRAAGIPREWPQTIAPFYPWQAVVIVDGKDFIAARRILGQLQGPPVLVHLVPGLPPAIAA